MFISEAPKFFPFHCIAGLKISATRTGGVLNYQDPTADKYMINSYYVWIPPYTDRQISMQHIPENLLDS